MSARASAGISQSVSSTRRSPVVAFMAVPSHVEDEVRAPAMSASLEAEVVVRDGLHERLRPAEPGFECRFETPGVEIDLRQPDRDQAFGLRMEERLGEALGEQGRQVASL